MDPKDSSSAPTPSAPKVEESAQGKPQATKEELRKILREDSTWSMRSIVITALTGISVAVISTQLTGLVSSVVLIGLMAFVTASVSEIYRIFLGLTGLGAKKAVHSLPLAQRQQLRANSSKKGELEANGEETTSSSKDSITEALQVVRKSYELSGDQRAKNPGIFKRAIYRLQNYGQANPFLWLVVIFFSIAVSTVAIAYAVTDGAPPQIVQHTVEVTKEEDISEEDRASIVDEAREGALADLETQPTAPATPVDSSAVLEELQGLSDRLSAMETEIEGIATNQPPVQTTAPSNDQALVDRISALESEREALEARLAELEAQLAEAVNGGSDPGSTPST